MNMISAFILPALAVSAIALPQFNSHANSSPKFPPSPSPTVFKIPSPAVPSTIHPVKHVSDPSKDQSAQVISEYRDVDFDGTFSYGFESSNGISAKVEGFIKDAGSEQPKQVIRGSYFYYDKNGEPVNVVYIADEEGFRAESEAIPKASPQILKSLEINAAAAAANRIQ